MARGVLGAVLLVLAASLALLPLVHLSDLAPSAELLRTLAQIGAVLLVAYAVEVSWLLKTSGERDAGGSVEGRASLFGYVVGVALSALLGIFLALVYAENDTADLAVVPEFGLGWVFFSLALLGLLVVLLPLRVFEWSQTVLTGEATEAEEFEEAEAEDLYETRELDE